LYAAHVTPRTAGWELSGLRVLDLPPGGWHDFDTGDSEWIVLPLSGSCTVAVGSQTFRLTGRESDFTGVTDFAYTPRDAQLCLATRSGGRFALAGARCEGRLPARYQPASAVPVELRGSGRYSRQVNNFAAAGAFECDRLIAVEVLTLGGNWSSFPPHKHDEDRPGESRLEEISCFEIAGDDASATSGSPPPATAATPISWPKSATATSCSSPTVGTVPPSPRPATTCTASTSWPAPAWTAPG
jgi:5-deoxy-glucuronate isomerase